MSEQAMSDQRMLAQKVERRVVHPYGEFGLLVEVESDRVHGLAEVVKESNEIAGAVEIVHGGETVFIRFETAANANRAKRAISDLEVGEVRRQTFEPLVIEVDYSGPDLESVAKATGLSVEDVVDVHTQANYVVSFCGFAPGFGYLSGLPPALQLPRRATPRNRVPVGAVAIADSYSAVYPTGSPGGWHLLGVTNQIMFDPSLKNPNVVNIGRTVRFVAR